MYWSFSETSFIVFVAMTVEQLNNRFLHANFDGYHIIIFPFI